LYMKSTFTSDKKILEVKNLSKKGIFEDISFDLYAGEILGFYGLVGSGRSEIAKTIYGLMKEDSGSIYFEDKPAKIKNARDAINRGIIYLSEDRRNESILPNMNIRENITISNIAKYGSAGFISRLKESRVSDNMVKSIRIKTPSIENNIMNLSGGNQQKVVIARSITLNPKVLFLDEPTHGIDVGAKAEVHALIKELTDKGIGVVLISSDLPEILGISSRIVVIRLGMVSKIFDNRELTEEMVLKAASHLKLAGL
jgi:ribose transport system ATP-binding protein